MSRGMSGPKPYEIRGGLGVDPNMASEVVLTSTQAGRHWKEDRPNAGYSGTPLWKLHQERSLAEEQAAASAPRAVKIPEGFKPVEAGSPWYYSEKRQVFWKATDGNMYVWDSVVQKHSKLYEARTFELRVAVGACFHERAVQVRHVLVKDLAKAGQALRMSIEHLDRPCALYALYEGHRGSPGVTGSGNACAEFCVKHLHQKLLPKLAAFRGYWEDERLEAAMRESFEELDAEFAEKNATVMDGCCAAVALIIGGRLVVASLGDVGCILCMRSGEATELMKAHAVNDEDDDDEDDEDGSATGAPAEDAAASRGPAPAIRWTRSFGNFDFKKPTSVPRLSSTPDVKVLHLQHQHRGFAFICRALYNAIGGSVAVSTVFRRSSGRPRMASGALVDAAVQWLGQVGDQGLGSIVVFFDRVEVQPDAGGDAPPSKRARKEEPSQVRLRHILLKHRECKSTIDKVRNKQVKRARGEAERILRGVLEECEGDADKRAFTQRCRDISECPSCLKAGELGGDLGWVKPGKHGEAFDNAAFMLQVGQLSDLVDSEQGIHVVMRTA